MMFYTGVYREDETAAVPKLSNLPAHSPLHPPAKADRGGQERTGSLPTPESVRSPTAFPAKSAARKRNPLK